MAIPHPLSQTMPNLSTASLCTLLQRMPQWNTSYQGHGFSIFDFSMFCLQHIVAEPVSLLLRSCAAMQMWGHNLTLSSHGHCSLSLSPSLYLMSVTTQTISAVLIHWIFWLYANVLSVCYAKNNNDTESNDDGTESNQKTSIKIKGLPNEKWTC